MLRIWSEQAITQDLVPTIGPDNKIDANVLPKIGQLTGTGSYLR